MNFSSNYFQNYECGPPICTDFPLTAHADLQHNLKEKKKKKLLENNKQKKRKSI